MTRGRRGRGAVSLLGVIFAAAALACGELGFGPVDVLSIRFDSLPFPAVVIGDTLRGPDGNAARLTAEVFRSGELVPDPNVSFLAVDAGFVDVTSEGFVIGQTLNDDGIRLVATTGSLQSQPMTLFVVDTPARLEAFSPLVDTLEYLTTERPLSEPFSVRVESLTGSPVRGWIVTFEITNPSDPAVVPGALVVDASRVSRVDTTDEQGQAARRFRLEPVKIVNPTGQDTVEFEARAQYRGAPISGSPVRFILIVRPRFAS